jgi:hypothetical protein
MAQRTGAREGREITGYPLGNRQTTGDGHEWNPPRDGDTSELVNMPTRGTVRGDWDLFDVNAAPWPPLEQEDTDDELHETAWWHDPEAGAVAPSLADDGSAADTEQLAERDTAAANRVAEQLVDDADGW